MIQKISIETFSPDKEEDQTEFKQGACQAFRKLKNWQIEQYRRAVDENKWYMSEKSGRIIGWKEAERDFLQNAYYGCAPKWRKEYCSEHCHFFSGCELGRQFCRM